jgi:hypothetical protein
MEITADNASDRAGATASHRHAKFAALASIHQKQILYYHSILRKGPDDHHRNNLQEKFHRYVSPHLSATLWRCKRMSLCIPSFGWNKSACF